MVIKIQNGGGKDDKNAYRSSPGFQFSETELNSQFRKYWFLQGSINFINNLIWTTNKNEA